MSVYEDGWNEAIAVCLRLLAHGNNAHKRIAELATYYPASEQRIRAAEAIRAANEFD